MAAIGTGPTLSDERVRQILGSMIRRAEQRVMAGNIGEDITVHEVARLAQEALDLRTANGILEAAAQRNDADFDTKATGQRGTTQ